MKVYQVQLQRTAGAYRTIKTFGTLTAAEEWMQKTMQEDEDCNTGNVHHCNRYRIKEEEVED